MNDRQYAIFCEWVDAHGFLWTTDALRDLGVDAELIQELGDRWAADDDEEDKPDYPSSWSKNRIQAYEAGVPLRGEL